MQRWRRGLEGSFRFDGTVGTRVPRCEEMDRPDNESGDEPGHAAKVVEQRRALAGEEAAIAHDVQVKKRRQRSEEADSQCGSASGGGTGQAMGDPVKCLG